eukprot:NODE_8961_length_1456_cov_9.054176.p1 GENE.NODE_8961_length_1456_cov_9.054176~~NODE_8961_length_1456_cov_9.054176.p1  ORF type:complete len:430 (-),score=92.47 NODE_8961_length_1456_cov_9.054176:166-1374(-)
MARLVCLALVIGAAAAITQEEREICHTGQRDETGRLCHPYATPKPKEESPGRPLEDHYGMLSPECSTVTWWMANVENNWGNCVNHTEGVDAKDGQTYRYVTTNSVPPYYFDPYCPFGLNAACANDTKLQYCGGYCIENEFCPFPDLKCGVTKSHGFTPYGDVWTAQVHYTKVPKHPNPTRQDRPGDMYEVVDEGEKTCQASTGVHLNGNSIQGPNDAGAINVDVAGFQLMCGGHVTPPVQDGPIAKMPMYHYHKAPDCTPEFTNQSEPLDHHGEPDRHGSVFGYMMDGFGLYTYLDIGGFAPVLDECGGHFGPVDDDHPEAVEYHYHATVYSPYHNACQGPALHRCDELQHGANFCGKGCGAEVCAQPGTNTTHLRSYLSQWNTTWLDSYTTNLDTAHTIVV